MKDLNPKLVGAFVIGAVILAVIGVVLFGSGDWFTKKRTFVTYFEGSVAGLNRRPGRRELDRGQGWPRIGSAGRRSLDEIRFGGL
jgi:hypothetical protein